MKLTRRQPREQRRRNPFVAFVSFGKEFFSIGAVLMLLGLALAVGATTLEMLKHGGILRLARGTDPQSLDPATIGTIVEDGLLSSLLFMPLIDLVDGTNFLPCAAESWQASPDNRIFTFKLRPGVRFSNGREVVARDYVFTFERLLHPTNAFFLGSFFSNVRGAKAFCDGHTNRLAGVQTIPPNLFTIELDHPDPTFPYLLSCTAMPQEAIVGKEHQYAVRPIGNGPYVVQEWIRGVRLHLTRNPYYSGPQPQHFDAVDVFIGGDDTVRQMMFERGELDVGPASISRAMFHRLTHHQHWRPLVEQANLIGTCFVALNTEMPPLDNMLVRRAINHAVDRDRRVGVNLGFYQHAEGVIPPPMPGYNPQLRGYAYNRELARQLLHESGLRTPLRSELWHDPSDDSRLIAQGIQWDLHQVGIEIDLKTVVASELLAASQIRRKVPMSLTGVICMIPDPQDILGMTLDGRTATNPATMNTSFYNNREVNRLLDEAVFEGNWERRFKIYQQVEELVVRDAPWIFLGHYRAFALRQPWLKGRLLEPLWGMRLDRVWIER